MSKILPRYRRKTRLSQMPVELQIALPHLLLSDDAKLAFVKNSKAGCTSVAHLIHQYSKGHEFSGNIHKDAGAIRQGLLYWEENLRLVQTREPYLFSFVRHPEKRVISAFLNFFIDQTNPGRKRHYKALNASGFVEGGNIERNFDVFLDYIQASVDKDIYHTDRHWRPQYINLGMPALSYHHIGKLENFADELAYIFSEAGIEAFDFEALNLKTRNKTTPRNLKVSAAQRDKIFQLYRKDFDLFGYS